MTRDEIIRAWRDEDYRLSLSVEQQAQVAHPAGLVEVVEELLDAVAGGRAVHPGTHAVRSFVGRDRVQPMFSSSSLFTSH